MSGKETIAFDTELRETLEDVQSMDELNEILQQAEELNASLDGMLTELKALEAETDGLMKSVQALEVELCS